MNNIDNMKECLEKLEVPLTEAHRINFNKVVAELKAMKVKSIDDYVDEFYKALEFTSDGRTKRYPMLMELYNNSRMRHSCLHCHIDNKPNHEGNFHKRNSNWRQELSFNEENKI